MFSRVGCPQLTHQPAIRDTSDSIEQQDSKWAIADRTLVLGQSSDKLRPPGVGSVSGRLSRPALRQVPGRKSACESVHFRAQGLRPLQIWVPDVRAPGFAEEAYRQSRAVSASDQADDDQAFVDSVSIWPED